MNPFSFADESVYKPIPIEQPVNKTFSTVHIRAAEALDPTLFPERFTLSEICARKTPPLFQTFNPFSVFCFLAQQNQTAGSPFELALHTNPFFLVEHTEECPPLVQNPGMAATLVNYAPASGQKTGLPCEDELYSQRLYPPLWVLCLPCPLFSLRTNMFELPLLKAESASTDFILVPTSETTYLLRKVSDLFVAGQTFLETAINDNRSQKAKEVSRKRLVLFLQRSLLAKKKVSVEHLCEAFPFLREEKIRTEVKRFCDIGKEERGLSWCQLRSDTKLSDTPEQELFLLPEDFCIDETIQLQVHTLQELGIKHWKEVQRFCDSVCLDNSFSEEDQETVAFIRHAIDSANWNVSKVLEGVRRNKGLFATHFSEHSTQITWAKMTKEEEVLLRSVNVPLAVLAGRTSLQSLPKKTLCALAVLSDYSLLKHIFFGELATLQTAQKLSEALLFREALKLSHEELVRRNETVASMYKVVKTELQQKISRGFVLPVSELNLVLNYYFRLQLLFNSSFAYLATGTEAQQQTDVYNDLEKDILKDLVEETLLATEHVVSGGESSDDASKKVKVKRQRLCRKVTMTDESGKEVVKTDYIYDPELIADFLLDQKDGGDRLLERLGLHSQEFKRLYDQQESRKGRRLMKKKVSLEKDKRAPSVVPLKETPLSEEDNSARKDIRFRSRGDPRLALANILKAALAKIGEYKNHVYFTRPVDTKQYKNYLDVVKHPICLNEMSLKVNTLVERALDFKVFSIEEATLGKRPLLDTYSDAAGFLQDLRQIVLNSELFNGPNHMVTLWAKQVFEVGRIFLDSVREELAVVEEKLASLQRKLFMQPFYSEILDAMKNCHESSIFLNPVNNKYVKDYYLRIKEPTSLYDIKKKINSLAYPNTAAFVRECVLLLTNCVQYNGLSSPHTENCRKTLVKGQTKFEELKEYMAEVEKEVVLLKIT